MNTSKIKATVSHFCHTSDYAYQLIWLQQK